MFNKHIFAYILGLFIVTSIIAATCLILFKFFGSIICLKHIFFLITLFLFVNILFHFLLINNYLKRPSKFVQIYLLSTVIKLIVYMTVILVYIFNITSGIKCVLLSFLILYLIFSFYEVMLVSSYLKNKTSK